MPKWGTTTSRGEFFTVTTPETTTGSNYPDSVSEATAFNYPFSVFEATAFTYLFSVFEETSFCGTCNEDGAKRQFHGNHEAKYVVFFDSSTQTVNYTQTRNERGTTARHHRGHYCV